VRRSVIHAGEHLARQLGKLSLSAAEFAWQLELLADRITAIMNRKGSVNTDTPCASDTSFEVTWSSGSTCRTFMTFDLLNKGQATRYHLRVRPLNDDI
jgi:hypothetical protein